MKCAFRNKAFRIFKNYFKSYNNNYYYSIIILLTLVKYGPSSVFVRHYFCSVRAATLNFFECYFYALRRFLAKFQGLYSVFRSYVIPMRMKTSAKKGQEKPTFVKKWVSQKRAYHVANFFCWEVSCYLLWKVSS